MWVSEERKAGCGGDVEREVVRQALEGIAILGFCFGSKEAGQLLGGAGKGGGQRALERL